MFRVLARFSILVYIVVLTINALYLDSLVTRLRPVVKKSLLVIIPLLSFIDMYVPLSLTRVYPVPQVYSVIKETYSSDQVLAVYPYSYTNIALVYLPFYQVKYANPRGYVNYSVNFYSEKFTHNLVTDAGIKQLGIYDVDLLLVYKKDSYYLQLEYLKNQDKLKVVYEDTEFILFKVGR